MGRLCRDNQNKTLIPSWRFLPEKEKPNARIWGEFFFNLMINIIEERWKIRNKESFIIKQSPLHLPFPLFKGQLK